MKDHLIRDELEECPYLPGETARMPLYALSGASDPASTDERLSEGQRRAGEFVYKTQCPNCQACIPVRIPVKDFTHSKSQKRILVRGDRELRCEIGPLQVDDARLDLFNKHRVQRGLSRDRERVSWEDYHWGFVRSCFESFEMAYYLGDDLVGIAINDLGTESLSAVYTFYDPDLKGQSLGTYSVLKQVDFCRAVGHRYLYLGFYIADCQAMVYKDRFRPQERLIDQRWERFD